MKQKKTIFREYFTLIELLIVIAIIGILLTLLMPSLNKAKKKALRAVCLSNANQISKAFVIYASNDNAILPAIGIDGKDNASGSSVQLYYWKTEAAEELRHKYLGGQLMVFDCPEWKGRQMTEKRWEWGLGGYQNMYRRTNYISTTTYRLTHSKTRDVDKDGSPDNLRIRDLRDNDTNKMLLGDTIHETTANVFEWSAGAPHLDNGKPAGGNYIFLNGSGKWKYFSALKTFYTYSGSLNDKTRDWYWWTADK